MSTVSDSHGQTLEPSELAAAKVASGEFAVEGDRSEAEHGEHHGFAHVSPISTLILVFITLVALTVITWAVALLETGDAELIIAMAVATLKAGIVATWFMHLRYDKPLNAMLFGFSTIFLALFLVLTISDANQYDHQIDAPTKLGATVDQSSDTAAPGGDGAEARP